MALTETKAWTLLAYTVADDKAGLSPLDVAAKAEIKAICDAADMGQLNVAVQVDFNHTAGVFRATLRPKKGRRFKDVNPEKYDLWRAIVKKAEQSELALQRESRELNAASGSVLEEFLAYGRQNCPAKRYAIFFYGHAFGPMGLFFDNASGRRAPGTLRLNELAGALKSEEGPAEVILFRDCFMDTLEMAYQLQGVARYMIATQAEAPIAGQWPWLSLMSALMGSADSSDVARALALQLGGYFNRQENRGPFADVPCSLIDVGAVHEMTQPMAALAAALHAARGDTERSKACGRALELARLGRPDKPHNPGDPALLDMRTMCQNLQELADDPVAPLANAVGNVLTEKVIKSHRSQKGKFRGLSIYYKPRDQRDIERSFIQSSNDADVRADERYYEGLALSQATGWHHVALDPLGV